LYLKNTRSNPGTVTSSKAGKTKARLGLPTTTPAEQYALANQEWWNLDLPTAGEVGTGMRLKLWRERKSSEMQKFDQLSDNEKEHFIQLALARNEEASGPATREMIEE
jgi:hypothetical protein